MKSIALYLREKRYFAVCRDAREITTREIPEDGIDEFLKEHRPSRVALIIAKPQVFFRRLSFPFPGRRQVSMILPSEMEDLLHRPADEFVVSWDFIRRSKTESEILTLAFDRQLCRDWQTRAKTGRFALSFHTDSHLLASFFGPLAKEPSCFLLLALDDYLLLDVIEQGALANSYSYHFSTREELAAHGAVIAELIAGKNLPVFWHGAADVVNAAGIAGSVLPFPEIPVERAYLLPYARNVLPPAPPPLTFTSAAPPVWLLSRTELGAAAVGAVLVLLLCSPYFAVPGRTRRLADIKSRMDKMFRAACPDATVVIDPLSQIRERLKSAAAVPGTMPKPVSILRAMAGFTGAIPQNLTVDISDFVISGNTLFAAGIIPNIPSLERLKTALDTSGRFYDIRIGDISFAPDKRVMFNLTGAIK